MAVYTEVSFDEAARLFARLDTGALSALEPIEGGIENTNYFADAANGRYVLTLFERLTHEQLPFYLQLMKHLAERGLPVPRPHADAAGSILHMVAGRPAAVVDRLRGRHHLAPDATHCALVGRTLAQMHLAAGDFAPSQPNLRGLAWWAETAPVIERHLSEPQAALLRDELAFQQQLAASAAYQGLPRAAIHADLFRDNVTFETGEDGLDRLSGVFDFYFAGVDTLLFDIGVCLNDWCIDLDSGQLVEERASAFMAAYDDTRALGSAELRLLPALMRAAALRFWISRLRDLHLPRDARLLVPHDPTHFERVLRARREAPWHPNRP